MNLLDILYTPLDTIPVPDYNKNTLLEWIHKNQKQDLPYRKDGSNFVEDYPWDISYARMNKEWQDNFNVQFPQLAHFFYAAFQLGEEDIFSVVLLPVKSSFVGKGFWHKDPDETGLRIYLENTESEKNFLLIRASKSSYISAPNEITPADGNDVRYSDTELSAKILHSRQAFFLNNIRAIHCANVSTVGAFRIAVIVTLGKKITEIPQHLKNLILSSAEKYNNLAVFRAK